MSINRIIRWSADNRFLVLVGATVLIVWGFWSLRQIPLDAIPDLSDTQVIVFTEWQGRSPDIIEDQITYPIVTSLIAAPKVKVARGVSFFGLSFVYVLFEDGTDIYWARSRVTEYMSKVQGQLPGGVTPTLGPDATGVGWGFQYVLTDESGQNTLQELRSFQDWYLRYWIESVPGVAEVATVGGFKKQYQVRVDPNKLLAYDIPMHDVAKAIKRSNNDVGGRIVEMSGREYIVRGRGYVTNTTDIENIVLRADAGAPITIDQIGDVEIGPQMRRGAADWNGEGEVVGGIVVVRFGENVLDVIERVKQRIQETESSLPPGVKLEVAYDRSDLIHKSIDNLQENLIEESIVVTIVTILFLWHFPSALVAIITLPIAILLSFIPMNAMGLSSNIMSLGGIAIAIGDLIDAAVVMVENAHKKIEHYPDKPRREVIIEAAQEVGRPLFFSLLITTVSFIPVFTLEAQEGKLFTPLALTKTFSMFWAAILSITIVPPLMVLLIRGKILPENKNPLNRWLNRGYKPVIKTVLSWPKVTLLAAAICLGSIYPLFRSIGNEFMPPLDEGSILFMPTTLPGISITEAKNLMQIQDKLIKTIPEVQSVFGKVGRADTPTDPAPLSMIETTIILKPKNQWRPGITSGAIIEELDEIVKLPGVTNAWTMPIKGRTDMLTTGIRTPVGIKILGPDLTEIQRIGKHLESLLKPIRGTRSVYAERVVGGTFLDYSIDRNAIAKYGLNVADVEMVIESAIGGMNVATTIEGPERYTINARYSQDFRGDINSLGNVLVPTKTSGQIPISLLANISIVDGPPAIRNENGSKTGWVFIDVADRDIGSYVKEAKKVVSENMTMHPGYALLWSGQYEYMERAASRLKLVVPITLLVILLLLYLSFRDFVKVGIVFVSVPFAVIGSFAFLYFANYNLSVAVWVGIIALAGVASETGVVMIVYLDEAFDEMKKKVGGLVTRETIHDAVLRGSVQRVRPKMMTVISTMLGLVPILWSQGTGADVMKRIAAPMVGGMISSTILTLIIIPVIYQLWRNYQLKSSATTNLETTD